MKNFFLLIASYFFLIYIKEACSLFDVKIWYKSSCYLNYLDKYHTNLDENLKKKIEESIKKLNDEHEKLTKNIKKIEKKELNGCKNLGTANIEYCYKDYLVKGHVSNVLKCILQNSFVYASSVF